MVAGALGVRHAPNGHPGQDSLLDSGHGSDEPERLGEPLPQQRVPRSSGERLHQMAGQDEAAVAVRRVATWGMNLAHSSQRLDVATVRVRSLAELDQVIAGVDPARVVEKLPWGDDLRRLRIAQAKVRQVLDHRLVEMDAPSSTNVIRSEAVQTLVIEPMRNAVSGVMEEIAEPAAAAVI